MSETKKLRADRKALERAILRALRAAWLGCDAGKLQDHVVVEIVGLERARRRAGGRVV